MRQFHAATTSLNHRKHIASILWIVCAIALTIVVLAYGRGSGPAFQNALPGIAVQQTSANPGSSVEAAVVERARHREAQARAELERRAAAEAAEKSRRALALADGANETQARKEREEMALRRAAVEEANRSAAETEGAWKRSTNHRLPAAIRRPAQPWGVSTNTCERSANSLPGSPARVRASVPSADQRPKTYAPTPLPPACLIRSRRTRTDASDVVGTSAA